MSTSYCRRYTSDRARNGRWPDRVDLTHIYKSARLCTSSETVFNSGRKRKTATNILDTRHYGHALYNALKFDAHQVMSSEGKYWGRENQTKASLRRFFNFTFQEENWSSDSISGRTYIHLWGPFSVSLQKLRFTRMVQLRLFLSYPF